MLDEACRVAAMGIRCPMAKVLERLPEQGRFLVRAGVGWRPGVVGRSCVGGGGPSPAGLALRLGEPVISNQLAAETRFRTPTVLLEHGVRRLFSVPIPASGRP